MDLGHAFLMAVIAAFLTWVLSKIFGRNIGVLITSVGTMFVFMPIVFIYLTWVFEMQSASSNITAVNNIANDTITRLINYLTDNLPSIVISDVAGTFVGGIIVLFK